MESTDSVNAEGMALVCLVSGEVATALIYWRDKVIKQTEMMVITGKFQAWRRIIPYSESSTI